MVGNAGMHPDYLIEVKPTGKTTGEIVWEWHLWDHLVQDHDRSKPNFGNVVRSPRARQPQLRRRRGPDRPDDGHQGRRRQAAVARLSRQRPHAKDKDKDAAKPEAEENSTKPDPKEKSKSTAKEKTKARGRIGTGRMPTGPTSTASPTTRTSTRSW